MHKNLNSVLNNVVRDLFEAEGAGDFGENLDPYGTYEKPSEPLVTARPQVGVDWSGNPVYGDPNDPYYQKQELAPGEVQTFVGSHPTTVGEKLADAGGWLADKAKGIGQTVAEWDRAATKVTEPAFDSTEDTAKGLWDSGTQSVKDLAAKHGSSIPGVGRQVEDWGYEGNPNVNFLDKAGKFFRRTGEDISGAFGNAKDAVVGAWNDATPAQKAAALGALGTTALASGAGALYLRKKQRAANKAAGRK